MGHFAKVVDGYVTQVIVAEPEFFDTFVDSSPDYYHFVVQAPVVAGDKHGAPDAPGADHAVHSRQEP